jgi:hypothetical protein
MFVSLLKSIRTLEGDLSETCPLAAHFLFTVLGAERGGEFFTKRATVEAMLKLFNKFIFTGRFRNWANQILAEFVKMVPLQFSDAIFASVFFKNSLESCLAADSEHAPMIHDYIVARADLSSVARTVWTTQMFRGNLGGSVCFWMLSTAILLRNPTLCNHFFQAGGHDQLVATLTKAIQQRAENVNAPVLLDTFATFLSLYLKHGKRKSALTEFMVSVESKTKAIFYSGIARPSMNDSSFILAQALFLLSPACEQQVINFLDKGLFLIGSERQALGLLKLVCMTLHQTQRDMIAFGKLTTQWNSCGPATPKDVIDGLCEVLRGLEIGGNCWNEVPGMIRRLPLSGGLSTAVVAVVGKMQEMGVKGIDDLVAATQDKGSVRPHL